MVDHLLLLLSTITLAIGFFYSSRYLSPIKGITKTLTELNSDIEKSISRPEGINDFGNTQNLLYNVVEKYNGKITKLLHENVRPGLYNHALNFCC